MGSCMINICVEGFAKGVFSAAEIEFSKSVLVYLRLDERSKYYY
jgi:hypothetical protein